MRARQEGQNKYVARSSFKLQQLDKAHTTSKGRSRQSLLGEGRIAVDLGAAPGGWTQVALESGCRHVFAVDKLALGHEVVLQGQEKGNRLTFLQGDFCSYSMQDDLRRHIVQRQMLQPSFPSRNNVENQCDQSAKEKEAFADVILSDMMGKSLGGKMLDLTPLAANTSGNAIRDQQASLDLLEVAFSFATKILRPYEYVDPLQGQSSVLVLKYFEAPEIQKFRKERLEKAFSRVFAKKVAASRSESSEMYFVCHDLRARILPDI